MTGRQIDPSSGIDYDSVLSDPSAHYPDPEAVLADAHLDQVQKKRLLEEWALDLSDHQVADAEGMGAGTPGASADEAEFLKRIHACRERLGADTDTEHPGSLWYAVQPE